MTLHAPLLSIVLAGAEAAGIDAIAFARMLNVACLGAEVLLIGALAKTMTRSAGFGVLAALVVAGSGELLQVHALLMSEPLFIALTLAGILALLHYAGDRRRLWLALGALALGLAALSRYAGLALPAAGAAFLVLDPDLPWRRKLGDAAIALTLGLTPLAAWMTRNLVLTGQTGGRSFGVHLEAWPSVRDQALAIVLNWFAPLRLIDWIMEQDPLTAVLVGAAGLGTAGMVALLMTRRVRQLVSRDVRLSGVVLVSLCLLSYLGIVFFAAIFSWPGADVNERVLSPLYPLLWLVLVAGLGWAWGRRSAVLRVIVGLLLLALLRNKLVYDYYTIRELGADGLGYASRAWRSSATIQEVVAMDPGVIYTNDTAAIYLLANRSSYWVPWALPGYDPASADRTEAEMLGVLLEQDGVVVLFGDGDLPAGWSGAGLGTEVQTDDGVILSPKSGAPG